jgi:hypothetical protein
MLDFFDVIVGVVNASSVRMDVIRKWRGAECGFE